MVSQPLLQNPGLGWKSFRSREKKFLSLTIPYGAGNGFPSTPAKSRIGPEIFSQPGEKNHPGITLPVFHVYS